MNEIFKDSCSLIGSVIVKYGETINEMTENGIRELFDTFLGCSVPSGSKWKSALLKYELFLVCEKDGGILEILPDTHLERFVKQDGQWVNRRGGIKEYTLTEHRDHYERLSWQEGTYRNYTFDKEGRKRISVESYVYDEKGNKVEHTEKFLRQTIFERY